MPPPEHTCVTTYWGKNDPIAGLVEMLNLISWRGALDMSDATYYTLCALQREIERAVDASATDIPLPGVGPSPWTPIQEAMFRASAQAFMAELVKDQWEKDLANGDPHVAGTLEWLTSNHTAQTGAKQDAAQTLDGGIDGHLTVVPDGLLRKVRNALGS